MNEEIINIDALEKFLDKNDHINPPNLFRIMKEECGDNIVLKCNNIDILTSIINKYPDIVEHIDKVIFNIYLDVFSGKTNFSTNFVHFENVAMFTEFFKKFVEIVWNAPNFHNCSLFSQSFLKESAKEFGVEIRYER